jgi:hypothetical protein
MLDTLANVKARLGITGTTYDTFLTQQIQLVSDVIEGYCRRKFATATWKQNLYKEDNCVVRRFVLFHYPVQEITTLKEDGETADSDTYRLNKPSGTITGVDGRGFFYASDTEITYVAGYDTIPSPILDVLDSVVQERYNKKTSGVSLDFGNDIQRISIPGAISIDFDYSLSSNERTSAYGTVLGTKANILDDWRSERAIIGSGKLQYVEEYP